MHGSASESVRLIGREDMATEPMLADAMEGDDEVERELSRVDHQDVALLEQDTGRPGLFVWLLTLSAGVSGLLFGYDTGVISATLVSIGSALSGHALSTIEKSFITSSTSLFALLISPVSSVLADKYGRKKVILVADVLFILGAIIQACANTVWVMIIGRSVIGLAVGAASFVAPLYIGELAPSAFRGQLVTINVLFITFGQVVAYLIGWGFSEVGDGWRWMVGLGAIPAGTQFFLLLFMPETPRWLVKVGRSDDAKLVLGKSYGDGLEFQSVASAVLRSIELEVHEEDRAKKGRQATNKSKDTWWNLVSVDWSELLHVGGNRRALIIACLLQGLQQLCGFNSLMYYSATIFSLVGFSSPILTSLSVALSNCIFTVIAVVLIDIIGRRRILIVSIPFMILGLVLAAAGFRHIDLDNAINSQYWAEIVVLISIIVYVCAYALGLGNVPWQQGELFPLGVRSLGSGIATATNWGANFIIGLTFLPMMDHLTPTWTFVFYAALCVIGWFSIITIYPETKGLSLEETGELLRDGWGVQKSLKRVESR